MSNILLFESYDNTLYIKKYYDEKSEGFVIIHRAHGLNELQGNEAIAILLANLGKKIVLLPNEEGIISADADVDDEIWEFKTVKATNLSSAVQGAIRRGKLQSSNILCFINQLYVIENITKGIYNVVKYDNAEMIQKIAILFTNGELIEMTREEVVEKSFVFKFYK
jgi:Contact-dependent growth inhibition CdiA C-terminal domain